MHIAFSRVAIRLFRESNRTNKETKRKRKTKLFLTLTENF